MRSVEEEFFRKAAKEEAQKIAAENAARSLPAPSAIIEPPPIVAHEEPKERMIWQGSPSQFVNFGKYLACFFFCWLILPVFYAIFEWIETASIKYEITSQRIRIQYGVFSKIIYEIEMYRIRESQITQPWLYGMFEISDITFAVKEETTKFYTLIGMKNAIAIKEKIRIAIESVRVDKVRVMEI
jgi:hypothetical protein